MPRTGRDGRNAPDGDPTKRKYSRLYDIAIPDCMAEGEINGRLGDIFDEEAAERHADVIRVE